MAWLEPELDVELPLTPLGADGDSVEEPELLLLELLPEDPCEEGPEPEPWPDLCEEPGLWSGSMYCELPAELPGPPAAAGPLVARPNPMTTRPQTSIRVSERIWRYSSSARRLHAPWSKKTFSWAPAGLASGSLEGPMDQGPGEPRMTASARRRQRGQG